MSTPADQPAPDTGRDPSVAARMEELYESHATLVRSVCSALLRDRVEAEDAMQQTFLSAHRALLNGSSPRDEAAWLATIARHEALSRVKSRMREPLPVDVEEHVLAAPDAHAVALGRHEAGELRDALAGLPPQQREAILLRELRGLSYQEVAATLSVTTAAVESLLFRARRSLQARLEGALAALSPGCWLQSVRELGSGGVAAPAAAKLAAVGVGTALFAGGAFGPKVLGLGHVASPARHGSGPVVHRIVRAAPAQAPVTFWNASAVVHRQPVDRRSGGDSHESNVSEAGRSSDGSEREGSAVAVTRHDDNSDQGARSGGTASSSDGSGEQSDGAPDDSRSGTTTPGTTTTGTTTTETTTTTYPVTTDD